MLPLVDIPDIVQHYAPFFATVFSPQAFQQVQRYISGLIVSENKTVDGINRLFVLDMRHQSSLNRLLTESPFSLDALNRWPRLLPRTSPKGRRFTMSWTPSLPCLRIEVCRSAFQGHGSAWLGDVQAKVGEMFGLSPRQTY